MIDKIFKDKHGNVVIFQWPNVPIIIAGIAWVLQFFVKANPYHFIFSLVFYLALGVWAVMEIGWGANYFRRGLGLVVFIFTIISLARLVVKL